MIAPCLRTRYIHESVRAVAQTLAVLLAVAGCASHDVPPDLGVVPAFRLVERSGEAFDDGRLRGKVSVVDFIFTTCPDICPALTAQMARLDELLGPGLRPQRVSITVDPLHDTPQRLRTYAANHHVGPDWAFLTGDRAAIASLLRDGFHVAFGDDGPATQPITHSDRLVLVDRNLRIRGYYHGRLPDELSRLVRDIQAVTAEQSP